jgi:hypothetical protein
MLPRLFRNWQGKARQKALSIDREGVGGVCGATNRQLSLLLALTACRSAWRKTTQKCAFDIHFR